MQRPAADYAKSDRPVGRTASDVEAVQIRGGKKAAIVVHQTGLSQCPQCGLAVQSEAELRDHEKTCNGSLKQSGRSEVDSSEVATKVRFLMMSKESGIDTVAALSDSELEERR